MFQPIGQEQNNNYQIKEMFEVKQIPRFALIWLKSRDFFKLYSQLTECEEIEEKKFEHWFNEMINNPLYSPLNVI